MRMRTFVSTAQRASRNDLCSIVLVDVGSCKRDAEVFTGSVFRYFLVPAIRALFARYVYSYSYRYS